MSGATAYADAVAGGSTATATADVTQQGGYGGEGAAVCGAGASSNLTTTAATGETNGGTLNLSEEAIGGYGGSIETGDTGGTARRRQRLDQFQASTTLTQNPIKALASRPTSRPLVARAAAAETPAAPVVRQAARSA